MVCECMVCAWCVVWCVWYVCVCVCVCVHGVWWRCGVCVHGVCGVCVCGGVYVWYVFMSLYVVLQV